jgi:hypothetical protein
MSERKKNHLQYLQINWHIFFKTKSFSHVINHKNLSSILKFWKLIHVIPTILKRSCLVLSYFEQNIKKCISSSNFTWADISLTPVVYPYILTWFNMEMMWWYSIFFQEKHQRKIVFSSINSFKFYISSQFTIRTFVPI